MDQDIKSILQIIEEHSSQKKFWDILAETLPEKILGLISIVSLIITLILIFIKSTQAIALITGLIFILSSIAFTAMQIFYAVAAFKHPLKGYAKSSEEQIKIRLSYINQLSSYSPSALTVVTQIITTDIDRIRKKLSILIGAINKAGFIPAGLALYYTATKIMAGSNDISTHILLSFIFGLYAGAFLGNRFADDLEYHVNCLKEAFELSSRKEQFKKSK